MQRTNAPRWDVEETMTAFQVRPEWYERYWFEPGSSGPTDINFHRDRAARLRALARQQVARFMLALIKQGVSRFVRHLRGLRTPVRHIRGKT